MSNYNNTKSTIAANVYENHLNQVTAEMVKSAINSVVDTLIAGGYLYRGVAHPGDAAVTPDANVFYLATEVGTYTNKGGLQVEDGEVAVLKYNGSWSKEVTGAATAAQVSELGREMDGKAGVGNSVDGTSDLDITDTSRRILAQFKNGHIKTKYFDSENIGTETAESLDVTSDLEISDADGNVLAQFKNGGFKTKNFDSENIEGNALQSHLKSLKVLCIGDSLTAGDYGSNPEGTANVHPENYPYFLSQYLGCSVSNEGICGATAISWWNARGQSVSYASFNVAIIMLGTNAEIPDNLATDVEPYNDYLNYTGQDGAFCRIIEKALSVNPTMSIYIVAPPFVDNTRRPAYYTRAYNSIAGCRSIAERYRIPILDMFKDGGVSKFNTAALQPIDGLHFGLDGYKRLGTRIASFILANGTFKI